MLADARARCARELRALGYDVVERRFAYSQFPGRFATPLIGAAAALIVGISGLYGAAGGRVVPLAVLAPGTLLLATAARWLARRGILGAPLLRAEGVNVEATRGARPALWLCAHLDSKSQPVPTAVRSVALIVEAFGLALTSALAIAAAAVGSPHAFFWEFAGVLTLIGAVPVVLSTVGSASPGALDNASGVVTVIEAARQFGSTAGIGILITDAEELGLAGARAWASGETRLTVLNCDGVDDIGDIQVMFTGARPEAILGAVSRASERTGIRHSVGRLVPGVLTDSVAFTDGGSSSVTFSRGTLRSLARVHSTGDSLERLHGTGIAETAALIAATIRALEGGDTH